MFTLDDFNKLLLRFCAKPFLLQSRFDTISQGALKKCDEQRADSMRYINEVRRQLLTKMLKQVSGLGGLAVTSLQHSILYASLALL